MRRLGLFAAAGSPARRASIVCGTVAAFALVMYSTVGVLAPRLATNPPAHPTAGDLAESLDASPGRGILGPTPTRTYAPRPSPDPTARARTDVVRRTPIRSSTYTGPARLLVWMNVDRRVASAANYLSYSVVAKNVGGTEFAGALTINLHTPKGTFRCGMTVAVDSCTTPGDYDGSSSSPNGPHTDPPGTTRLVRIPIGRSVTLLILKVLVSPQAAGTVLHNHTHVDGPVSITETAPNVSGKPVTLKRSENAPDVWVPV